VLVLPVAFRAPGGAPFKWIIATAALTAIASLPMELHAIEGRPGSGFRADNTQQLQLRRLCAYVVS
jgi:hypothetical protein